ncbi:uncharacterized protein [Spinacia oleracea]|uniref:Endonuclease/exonuclease/phosphatase domain-containing protein n=1 Tax=Spinacia oleracea TaxID=3562 RepID=A0ABM3RAV8_SPIOL|nr:uncharacterized protein LOC130467849 [Spinacia oleracea]
MKALCPILEMFVRWWMTSAEAKMGQLIVPMELEFMHDPIPIFPQLRKTWQLSSRSPLRGTVGATTNGLMVISTTESFPQVEIKTYLVKEIEQEIWEAELEFVARKKELWSMRSRDFIDKIDPLTQKKFKEFSRTRNTPDPMIIVAWNCRGMARRGFRTNLYHLYTEHRPDIIILTETKTSQAHTKHILKTILSCQSNPFENYVMAEPYGLSGGIVVMWDPRINFKLIGSDQHAIHGIVEGTPKKPKKPVFASKKARFDEGSGSCSKEGKEAAESVASRS